MTYSNRRAARGSVSTACALLLCIGCETSNPVTPTTTPPAPAEASSYVTVSSETPDVGAIITVVGNADRAGGTAYGSFTSHLTYDVTRLEFVDEMILGGGMRALHVTPGVVAVAGAAASTTGFADGRLFALHFRVLAAHPFTALAMRMDELNGVDFSAQLTRLTPRSSITLDPSIK